MTGGRRIIVIAGAVAAMVIAVAAGIYAHQQATAPKSAPPAQAGPAEAPPPPASPASPSPSGDEDEESPEALPSPPPMWAASAAQQQAILSRASSAAVHWASALFSRTWSENETSYISRASRYQTAAMTRQETQYEAGVPARQDWKQLRDQQCTVTASSPVSMPPDNYTAGGAGPHVPSLESQWQVVVFTTAPACRHPVPSLPPVPSVHYERLVELVPAKPGDPDGAWAVSAAYSSWDGTSQGGSAFGGS